MNPSLVHFSGSVREEASAAFPGGMAKGLLSVQSHVS